MLPTPLSASRKNSLLLFPSVSFGSSSTFGGGRREVSSFSNVQEKTGRGTNRHRSSKVTTTIMSAKKRSKRKKERAAARELEKKTLIKEREEDTGEGEEEEEGGGGDVKDQKIIDSKEVFFQSMELAGSYKQRTKKPLLEGNIPVTEAVRSLYYAPFVCCSHDEEDVFNYSNKAAQNLWELEWDEFVGMPSKKSADETQGEIQDERRKLLDEAKEKGVVYDYNGVRKSKSGKEFRVLDATLWMMVDKDGNTLGQAVKFEKVEYIENGEIYKVGDENGEWIKASDDDDDEKKE